MTSRHDHPTLPLLATLGYTPLSRRDALHHRGGRLRNVILHDILADRLLAINSFSYRDRRYRFDLEDAHEAIRGLHPTPDRTQGLPRTNQAIYDLLVLGTTITQNIGGDSKSYPFRYIDWEDPTNNVYHVTADMEVERTGSFKTRRLDVVAFVNGIPFVVVEDKRASEGGVQAGTQLIGYQNRENIPHLFHFAQLLVALNGNDALYATVGTPKKFRHRWREPEPTAVRAPHPFHALCLPDRLLDLVRRFTVFDAGTRKIARHQQFFAVRRAIDRVKHIDPTGRRQGGAIWHTQGSGKSLTMVMLGRALALDRDIVNPRIIIVTDRTDLDHQIRDTFKSCKLEPVRARSGRHLITLIRDRAPLVTTLVNKFDTALRYSVRPDDDPNLFVLVDESHRSHTGPLGGNGQLAMKMRRLLPKACYLGFTGTPFLTREKSTFSTVGAVIHRYATDEAVEDGAVLPLLYEARFVDQQVTADTIARDISEHFRRHWQGTGFKAQLVAPSKASAIRFKEMLDEIGDVTSEIVISPPDDREGNEQVDRASKDRVRVFWDETMARHGSETEYNRRVIDAFKGPGHPEILIVVSKLLTGFDAPRNTVLYVCKPLKEHSLLQAIARVNRLHEEGGTEKQFGFIIDYQGLLGELDSALTTYSALEGYDPEDLVGAVHDVREEIGKLRHYHGRLWDLFRPVPNRKGMEAMERFLADDARRQDFYGRLRALSRCLHISLSSEKVLDVFDEARIAELKRDWRSFSELRRSVRIRYQEAVDVTEFESKIKRLLHDHVAAMPAETVIELVDIHDTGMLKAVVEETGVTAASRADRIASATRRAITERMDRDPAFYERFSKLLEDTIEEYREKRRSEGDYLDGVVRIAWKVARGHEERDVPAALGGNHHGMAFYGIFKGSLKDPCGEPLGDDETAEVALTVMEIIHERLIVNVWSNETAQNDCATPSTTTSTTCYATRRGSNSPNGRWTPRKLMARIMRLAQARFPQE